MAEWKCQAAAASSVVPGSSALPRCHAATAEEEEEEEKKEAEAEAVSQPDFLTSCYPPGGRMVESLCTEMGLVFILVMVIGLLVWKENLIQSESLAFICLQARGWGGRHWPVTSCHAPLTPVFYASRTM